MLGIWMTLIGTPTIQPNEPFIFEPGTTEMFHVFFHTDYHGPVWVRAVLVDEDDYKWRADRLFVLP